ncbi:20531_t:CDS:2, partial [Racocetra persica]
MLHNKLQELSMHVSDFICQSIRYLKLSEYEYHINDLLPNDSHIKLKYTKAYVIIYPGLNRDGWWICNDFINQLTKHAIPIFERMHSNKIALFMFDNSSNYVRPKRIRQVLEECDLWVQGLIKWCNVIEAADHICYCELNYIESFWAETKCIVRLNCDYSFRGLKRTILRALNSVSLIKICHFACRSERFMSVYKLGFSGKAAVFAEQVLGAGVLDFFSGELCLLVLEIVILIFFSVDFLI